MECFLTVFLNEPIKIVEILESEGNQQQVDGVNWVDIKAKNNKGKIIIVELQNIRELYYHEHVNAIMIQNDVLGNAKLEGRAEGRVEEKIENAKRFLAMGLSCEQVAQGTNLPLEEIQKLAENL